MRIRALLLAFVATVLVSAGCEIFEDQTPRDIFFRMSGPAGQTVTVIYSKTFVAGVDEFGVTNVEVFRADTVVHVLPIDTVIDLRLERRLYLRAEPGPTDTLNVNVDIDVDGRSLFDRDGSLFPTIPWQFLYQYNARFTDDIEVQI